MRLCAKSAHSRRKTIVNWVDGKPSRGASLASQSILQSCARGDDDRHRRRVGGRSPSTS